MIFFTQTVVSFVFIYVLSIANHLFSMNSIFDSSLQLFLDGFCFWPKFRFHFLFFSNFENFFFFFGGGGEQWPCLLFSLGHAQLDVVLEKTLVFSDEPIVVHVTLVNNINRPITKLKVSPAPPPPKRSPIGGSPLDQWGAIRSTS